MTMQTKPLTVEQKHEVLGLMFTKREFIYRNCYLKVFDLYELVKNMMSTEDFETLNDRVSVECMVVTHHVSSPSCKRRVLYIDVEWLVEYFGLIS